MRLSIGFCGYFIKSFACHRPLCTHITNASAAHGQAGSCRGWTERSGTCPRSCHCEERSDAAIRIPSGCDAERRKRERIPMSACGLLGMTGLGNGALFDARQLSHTGPGNPAPTRGNRCCREILHRAGLEPAPTRGTGTNGKGSTAATGSPGRGRPVCRPVVS